MSHRELQERLDDVYDRIAQDGTLQDLAELEELEYQDEELRQRRDLAG